MATKTPRMPSRVKVKLPGLSRARKARGLSQKELERLAEVSFITISRIENGHLDTTMGTAKKLARALRTKVEDLRTDDEAFVAELARKIGHAKENYLDGLAGGQAIHADQEENLAALYARLAVARGGGEEAIKEVVLKAIRAGKGRGWANAQEEVGE